MTVKISANCSIMSDAALDRETARKSHTPITGSGPLAQRYAQPKHGLWRGDILIAIEDAWDGFRNAETDEQAVKEHRRWSELRDIARRM